MTSKIGASLKIFACLDKFIVELKEIAPSPSFKNRGPADTVKNSHEFFFTDEEFAICSIYIETNSCFLCNGDVIPVSGVIITILV